MIGDTLTLTIAGSSKVLQKVNQDNYGSAYFLRGTGIEYSVRIEHLLPSKKNSNLESHKVTLVVDSFDVDGVLLTRSEVWTVLRTTVGRQVPELLDYGLGLVGWHTSANITKVIARES